MFLWVINNRVKPLLPYLKDMSIYNQVLFVVRALLYSMDEVVDPAVTVKATGDQWGWAYEYSNYVNENNNNNNKNLQFTK